MKRTMAFTVVAVAAVSACGDPLGPDDPFDIIGTWEAKATPASDYDCQVEGLTLIITAPPADSARLIPGSFSGTTTGGAARCLSWRRDPLPPGIVWGRVFKNAGMAIVWDENMQIQSQTEGDSVWVLELNVYIEEEQFQLGLHQTEIRNPSHIEGWGTMGGGGVFRETCGWGGCGYDVTIFDVNVTLTKW